jgi:hypothetical protein
LDLQRDESDDTPQKGQVTVGYFDSRRCLPILEHATPEDAVKIEHDAIIDTTAVAVGGVMAYVCALLIFSF